MLRSHKPRNLHEISRHVHAAGAIFNQGHHAMLLETHARLGRRRGMAAGGSTGTSCRTAADAKVKRAAWRNRPVSGEHNHAQNTLPLLNVITTCTAVCMHSHH